MGSEIIENRRRICVFTGSRSDYGPLRSVLERLNADPGIDLQVLVSGGHLIAAQGHTVDQIDVDGFAIGAKVDMVLASDSGVAAAKSFGMATLGYADALRAIEPDLLVVLGDRYEALAAAIAASLQSIPIAHIGGGEVTAGALDDLIRHAISKFADLHFVANATFRARVRQLGENPERIYVSGSPGLDTIRSAPVLDRAELEKRVGLELVHPVVLVTYHPATADLWGSKAGLAALLEALDGIREGSIVITATNVDTGGADIYSRVKKFADERDNATFVMSLGQDAYLALMRFADVVVGNSSSGLVEAPAVGTPTVNVGSRQKGRPRAASVLDCVEDREAIAAAILKALDPKWRAEAIDMCSPWGDGFTSERIVEALKAVDLSALGTKEFYDIEGEWPL